MKSRTARPSARNSGLEAYPTWSRPRWSRPARTFSPVPTGTVDFITRIGPALELGELVDDRPHAREVGVAGVGRRSVDAHEEELAIGDVRDVQRVRQPARVALEELGHILLVERDLTCPECRDLLGDDVANDDVVAELGEAHSRDKADPTGAEDANLAHGLGVYFPLVRGLRPLAIASMVSFDRSSSSVLTTQ